jgi:GPH family glycoside/pentoside/hexuronide:cation symporter
MRIFFRIKNKLRKKVMSYQKSGLLSSKRFDSIIKSANVQNNERWLGYFLAPSIMMTMFAISGQSYLNVFYTDVLKMTSIAGGMFLVALPIVSKILDAITNIIMGQLIERTRSRQGKARPWVLISAPLMAISGILLFTVPTSSITVQVIWVMFSYNLFFCVAFTMYNISHTLLVPLSTRNSKQRDTLAMASAMGQSLIPGTIVSILFPALILPAIGIDQGKWITVMSVISILALPAVMLEYYLTKERVTEETAESKVELEKHSIGEQLKACFSSKYWFVIIGIIIIWNIMNNIQVTGMVYYCNWVLGTYNDGVTMTLTNAVGQAPLGFGILFLWPLVKKFGKRNVMIAGFTIAIAGCVISLLNPRSMGQVLGGLVLKSVGTIPITYTLLAMLSDSLDHVEWQSKFRCDGLSSAVYSIIFTVASGISLSLFNMGLGVTGYVAPAADGSWVPQNASVQNFFIWSLFLFPIFAYFLVAFLLSFYHVEKELPQIQKDVVARHKAEAEARGEVYVSPEEKARLEQEELDRVAEEKRIGELKAACAKKGLDYATEEAKYQQKLAAQKAKAEAKKNRGTRRTET